MNASVKSRLGKEYKDVRALIYNSKDLSWEKKLLRVRRLQVECHRKLRELERGQNDHQA